MDFRNEFKRLLSLKGRQSRAGHITVVVGTVLFAIGLFTLSILLVPNESQVTPAMALVARSMKIFSFVFYFLIAPVLVFFSAVKRLHDLGRGGPFFLFYFVPLANAAFGIWLLTQRGDVGENKYGMPRT